MSMKTTFPAYSPQLAYAGATQLKKPQYHSHLSSLSAHSVAIGDSVHFGSNKKKASLSALAMLVFAAIAAFGGSHVGPASAAFEQVQSANAGTIHIEKTVNGAFATFSNPDGSTTTDDQGQVTFDTVLNDYLTAVQNGNQADAQKYLTQLVDSLNQMGDAMSPGDTVSISFTDLTGSTNESQATKQFIQALENQGYIQHDTHPAHTKLVWNIIFKRFLPVAVPAGPDTYTLNMDKFSATDSTANAEKIMNLFLQQLQANGAPASEIQQVQSAFDQFKKADSSYLQQSNPKGAQLALAVLVLLLGITGTGVSLYKGVEGLREDGSESDDYGYREY